MKKEKLMNMKMEKLVDLAMEQQEKIDKLRGYKGGIKRKDLEEFDKEVLVNCYLKNQENFHFED